MARPPRIPTFHFYQLQIHPLYDKPLTLGLEPISYDEIVQRKNEFTANALRALEFLEYTHGKMEYAIVQDEDQRFLLTISSEKKIKRITKQRQEQKIDSWPYLYVMVDARAGRQRMAIENNPGIIQSHTVARALADNLTRQLRPYGLGVFVEPVFDRNEFWDVVDEYPNSITEIGFELIRPNMAAISRTVSDELKQLQGDTNAVKSTITLESDKDSNLTLSRENEQIEGLVKYASEGGGSVHLKIGRYKKVVTSEDVKIERQLDDIEVHGDGASVKEIFSTLGDLIEESMPDQSITTE